MSDDNGIGSSSNAIFSQFCEIQFFQTWSHLADYKFEKMSSHVRGLHSRVQHVLLSCLLPCPGSPCTGAYIFWGLIFFNYFKYIYLTFSFIILRPTGFQRFYRMYLVIRLLKVEINRSTLSHKVHQEAAILRFFNTTIWLTSIDFTEYKIQNWTSYIFLGSMSLNRLKMRHRPYQQSRYFRKHKPKFQHRHFCAYLIIVADAADAVSVNFSGRCKFLQI